MNIYIYFFDFSSVLQVAIKGLCLKVSPDKGISDGFDTLAEKDTKEYDEKLHGDIFHPLGNLY